MQINQFGNIWDVKINGIYYYKVASTPELQSSVEIVITAQTNGHI